MFQLNYRRSAMLSVVTMFFGASLASAALFERDIPTINLNNTVPANQRSNAALYQGSIGGFPVIIGDDFYVGAPGDPNYIVTSLTVWVVGTTPVSDGPVPDAPSNAFTLYGNVQGDPLNLISNNYTATRVTPGGQDYLDLATGTTTYPIYKIVFGGLNSVVVADTYYDFAVDMGTSGFALYSSWAAQSDGIQNDPDDRVAFFDQSSKIFLARSAIASEPQFPTFNNWNNVSDINVIIEGTMVPEPSTFGFLTLGIGAMAYVIRRRRA